MKNFYIFDLVVVPNFLAIKQYGDISLKNTNVKYMLALEEMSEVNKI